MKGWIYKITHKNKETGKNDYPAHCYIGQTRVTYTAMPNLLTRQALPATESKKSKITGIGISQLDC